MSLDEEYILATYLLKGEKDLYKKAQGIAVGLTVGTWTELPSEKKESMAQHLGKVVDVVPLPEEEGKQPVGKITIAYPIVNVTPDLPSILTTVFGKLSLDGSIKLLDLHIPDSLLSQFPGPRFGIQGVRDLLQMKDRPLLMSIFKQCIGLSLDELEEEYRKQIEGGVDLVKDDEIFFADGKAPAIERVKRFEALNRQREERTGRKALYAVNLTGPVNEMVDRAKRLVEAGASGLLLNVFVYGLDILHRLASDPDIPVPILAHPAFAGAIYASPEHGVSSSLLLGKFLRLAGADIVLYPSPYGSVAMPKEESLSVADRLRRPYGNIKPSLPAPSAGIHPGLVPVLIRDFGPDLVINAGGGIHGHPQGSTAGGRAFLDAISAIMAGYSLREAAARSVKLSLAIEKWGVVEG
ncbi:2,3-diketo-5-methylthiopentyl-1-phosphate enolase (DK-MTP-1-P enolase) [[Clostridium] ultunense Esp]|nr:2,3-diketo-5-methylthiopentyl-1-phosphate enolase (DK-MTP-1-P enolase) [[Clostridium] ultunense Esp]